MEILWEGNGISECVHDGTTNPTHTYSVGVPMGEYTPRGDPTRGSLR